MFGRIKNFFIESRHELAQVQWPTRTEAIYLTIMVIIISIVLAAFFGGLDYIFTHILKTFILNV